MIGFRINLCCAIVNVAIWSFTNSVAALVFAGISVIAAIGFLAVDL